MRLAFTVLIGLVLCSGLALADPDKIKDEPMYDVDLGGLPRSEIYEEEPLNDTCPGQEAMCGDVLVDGYLSSGDSDWITFTATAGTELNLFTMPTENTDTVDTYIELYADDCVTQLDYDDDGGPGLYSWIVFVAPYDGTYNLEVHGYGYSSTGYYDCWIICGPIPGGACCFEDGHCEILDPMACGDAGGEFYGIDEVCEPNPCPQPPPPPENDTCAGAEEFGYFIERCTAGSLDGDLTYANGDYSPTNYCTGYSQAAGKDVVYYMDLMEGDIATFYYDYVDYYDAAFYILTDCDDMDSCVVGADDPEEIVDWVVPATGRYYLVLDAYSSGQGSTWTLDYSIECPPPPPMGACCFEDGSCVETLEEDCDGYAWYVDVPCDPNPCEPIPVEENTWGEIKTSYR
jgi:hypothetical protein